MHTRSTRSCDFPELLLQLQSLFPPCKHLLHHYSLISKMLFKSLLLLWSLHFGMVLFSRISKRSRKASSRLVHIRWSWSFSLSSLPFVSSTPLEDQWYTQLCPSGLLPSQAVSEDMVSTLTSPVPQRDGALMTLKHHQAERQVSSKPPERRPAKILFFDKFIHKLNILYF